MTEWWQGFSVGALFVWAGMLFNFGMEKLRHKRELQRVKDAFVAKLERELKLARDQIAQDLMAIESGQYTHATIATYAEALRAPQSKEVEDQMSALRNAARSPNQPPFDDADR